MMADDAEDHVAEAVDEVEHRRAALAGAVQREAEEQREQTSTGRRSPRRTRRRTCPGIMSSRNVGDRLPAGRRVGGRRRVVERRRIDVHPGARAHDVDDDEPDDERERLTISK